MEKKIFSHKLLRNISSPLLLGNDIDILNNKYLSNKSSNNKLKISFSRKLLPIKSANKILLKKLSFTKKIFSPDSLKSRNKQILSKSYDIKLNEEEITMNTNKIMDKYFNPDIEEDHEKSNKLNEQIDINQLLTFYSKLKYKQERAEVEKMIKSQKI